VLLQFIAGMSLAGENDDQDLLDWETVNALEYVRKSKIAEQQKLDSRVTAIGDWCVESGDKMFSKYVMQHCHVHVDL